MLLFLTNFRLRCVDKDGFSLPKTAGTQLNDYPIIPTQRHIAKSPIQGPLSVKTNKKPFSQLDIKKRRFEEKNRQILLPLFFSLSCQKITLISIFEQKYTKIRFHNLSATKNPIADVHSISPFDVFHCHMGHVNRCYGITRCARERSKGFS